MLKGLVTLAILAVCATAQTNDTQPIVAPMDMAVMQASGELMMAQKYLGVILKFQHSMYTQQAAQMYIQMMMLSKKLDGEQVPQQGMGMYGFEEDEGVSDDDIREQIGKLDLYGGYFLMFANKIRLFQVIYQAGELQNEYFQDRAMQLSIQAGGQTVPPQFTQLMYLKIFSTYMKTLKLSYALQTIAHWTTWLEDELDVNTAIVSNSPDVELLLSSDELITDKEFAFAAYSQYASIDFTLFFLDLYWEYSLMNMMAPPAAANNNAAAASFLETEAEAEPAQPAKPFVSAYLAYQHPYWFTKIYKYYFLMYQSSTASSGLQLAYAERASYTEEDPDKADQLDKMETMAADGFAYNLYSAAHIQYITALFDVYSMYASSYGQQPQQAAH